MKDENKRIVEINGVKIEVDLRTAKQVASYKVGDRVKVLVKNYSGSYTVSHGIIVAFDEFIARPSITICHLTNDYSPDLKFVTLNKDSKDVEIAPCNDDVLIEKGEVVEKINRSIETKKAEIIDLESKRNYFEQRFGAWFKI